MKHLRDISSCRYRISNCRTTLFFRSTIATQTPSLFSRHAIINRLWSRPISISIPPPLDQPTSKQPSSHRQFIPRRVFSQFAGWTEGRQLDCGGGRDSEATKRGGGRRKRRDESGKHYNKSAGLWRECKIAGTDLVVYNTEGVERGWAKRTARRVADEGGGGRWAIVRVICHAAYMEPAEAGGKRIDYPRGVVVPIGRLSMVIACTKRHM